LIVNGDFFIRDESNGTHCGKRRTLKFSAKFRVIIRLRRIIDSFVHYTTVYDWRRQLDSFGHQGFLDYEPSYPGRGINRFEKFLQTHNIDHSHARAHHPQTLGKVEA
jgi:hypothetical protein